MLLGYFQSTTTLPYILGTVLSWLMIVVCIAWMLIKGKVHNNKYKYAPGFKYPKVLLVIRFFIMAFCMGIVINEFRKKLGPNGHAKAWALGYFTTWSFLMINVYFITSFCLSLYRSFAPDQVPVCVVQDGEMVFVVDPQPRNRTVRALMTIQQLVGDIIAPGSVVISIAVWGMLAPQTHWGPQFVNFMSFSQHACNTVFMFTDFMLAGWRVNPRHFPIAGLMGSMYMAWHLIANAAWGMMAYPFMMTDKPIFLAYVFGIAAIGSVSFTLYWALSLVKARYMNVVEKPSKGRANSLIQVSPDAQV